MRCIVLLFISWSENDWLNSIEKLVCNVHAECSCVVCLQLCCQLAQFRVNVKLMNRNRCVCGAFGAANDSNTWQIPLRIDLYWTNYYWGAKAPLGPILRVNLLDPLLCGYAHLVYRVIASQIDLKCAPPLKFSQYSLFKFKKKILFVLSLFSAPHDLFCPDLSKSLAKISQRPATQG